MDADRKAQAGIILATVSVGSALLWWYSTEDLFLSWYLARHISPLAFAVLSVSLPVVLAIVGSAAYIAGRRAFWSSNPRSKRLLAFLGLVFMLLGGFFGAWYWSVAAFRADMSLPEGSNLLVHYLGNNSPYFVLFALWFVSGLLMFADALDSFFSKT